MTETPCPRCAKATNDGLLCHPCTALYVRARKDLARFAPDLRTAWLRQDRVERGTIHRDVPVEAAVVEAEERAIPARLRSATGRVALVATPLPVNLDAGALYRRALGWLRWIPRDGAELRRHVDAADITDATRRLAHQVEQAIDRRDPELYLGTCDAPDSIHVDTDCTDDEVVTFEVTTTGRVCGVNLYASAGDTVVTCQACGYEYPIQARREQMLAEVRNLLERPKVIADALTSLDMPVTAATLDTWISRDKRLHGQGRPRRDGLPLILADPVYDDDGKPLYLLGPIIDRIEALRARGEQTG